MLKLIKINLIYHIDINFIHIKIILYIFSYYISFNIIGFHLK